MANFTQNSAIQYKEYVPQNPVNAMLEVGIQREQQLAQGIEKVNTIQSTLAGLDILNETQKQYTNNKINQLKTGITTQLSGDFSDQRIVNQISGAANQIYKDPIVQNGVTSTANYRKGVAEWDEARKKGENGPSNDYFFSKKAKEYSESTDPYASFNYKYEKYTDVEKHKRDIISSILPSGTSIDEAFTKDGKLAESVIRNGFKGVKPEQIKAALRAGLSPQDWRQMELDGVYQYSNLPPEQFASTVQKEYASIADQYKNKITLLENAPTTSAAERASLNSQRDDLLKELDSLKAEYDGVTSTFNSGDTDSGKAKLHTLKSINNTAAALAHAEVESHYVGDTPQQMEKWRQDKAQDWKKFSLKFEQDERFHLENRQDKQKELKLKEKESNPLGSWLNTVNADELPTVTLDKLNQNTNDLMTSINNDKNQFISQNKLTPGSKEAEDWYNSRMNAYLKKPATLNPIELEHFQQIANKQKELDSDLAFQNEVKTKFENDPNYKKLEQLIPKDAKSLAFTDVNGARYNFTPKELVNFNEKRNNYITTTGNGAAGPGARPATTIDFEKAKKELTPNEYKLFEISVKNNPDQGEQTIKSYLDNYRKSVNTPYRQELKKMSGDVNKYIANRLLINQGANSSFDLSNPAGKDRANNLLNQIAVYADGYNGKIGNLTSENLRELVKDDKKAITISTRPGNKYQESLNEIHVTSGGKDYVIPSTDEQMTNVFGGEYKGTPAQQAFAPIKNQLQKAGGYTTQLGPTPYLDKSNFTNVVNYGISGNVIKGSGGYMLELNIFDPITNKSIKTSIPKLLDEEGIITFMNSISDQYIFSLLAPNHKAPTQAELKNLQEQAQKPF